MLVGERKEMNFYEVQQFPAPEKSRELALLMSIGPENLRFTFRERPAGRSVTLYGQREDSLIF